MLKGLFRGLLNFILPPVCVSCGEPLEPIDEFMCKNCENKLVPFGMAHPWKNKHISSGVINDSFSMYRFINDTPIQHMLHAMKYEKMRSIGSLLGKKIAENLPPDIKFEYTVPVPLHIAKKRERTYNQSDFVCRGISRINGTIVLNNLIKRSRFTKSQTKLDKSARMENVRGVFEINPKHKGIIAGRTILLADDVITTGATILECARVLKENGAGYVMVCSAAYDALD